MATVEVVPPSICKDVDIGEGIFIPIPENRIPNKIEVIKGFFESFLITLFNPSHIAPFLSLYSSKIVMEIVTLTIAIEAADKVAKCSPSLVGKANVIKGMPKKAKLPKTVLRTSR